MRANRPPTRVWCFCGRRRDGFVKVCRRCGYPGCERCMLFHMTGMTEGRWRRHGRFSPEPVSPPARVG